MTDFCNWLHLLNQAAAIMKISKLEDMKTWMGDHLQSEFKSRKSVGEIQLFKMLGNTKCS